MMEKNEILSIYGRDIAAMARALAEEADLAALVGDTGKRVGLKPNLVVPQPAAQGATTHPEVAAGLVEYLQDSGFKSLAILEGSWVGARTAEAFTACGYTALSRRYGLRLIDTQRDAHTRCNCAGMQIDICQSALEMDFVINLPVMKGHCQTALTCALKNNKGVIPNAEKRRFHTMGLHRPIAHLNTVAKSDFVVVDAVCGDLDFEEGGTPVRGDRLFAGRDVVLCDAFAARQMGLALEEVPYIGMAEALGVGSANLQAARVRELSEGSRAGAAPAPTGKARRLAAHIREDAACSACYAALVRALGRLDARALAALPGPVCVGQGFAGKAGEIGVGRCTAGFCRTVAGCPPAAGDILDVLLCG